jgi:hypothetical protein
MSVREILSRNYKDAINREIWFSTLLYIFVGAVIDYDFTLQPKQHASITYGYHTPLSASHPELRSENVSFLATLLAFVICFLKIRI